MSSAHVQRNVRWSSVRTSSCQRSVSTFGVGPADRTGKSWTSYWPGGSVTPDVRGRPRNPGVSGGPLPGWPSSVVTEPMQHPVHTAATPPDGTRAVRWHTGRGPPR